MNLNGQRLWQVGAGDTDRAYQELCLAHNVMIAGPGNPGAFSEAAYANQGDIRNSLRRFCCEANRGDLVLLRIGTGTVHAVGRIEDDGPGWSDAFEDIDGWDLQHFRRVRWFPNTSKVFPATTFGTKARTFAAVNVPAIRSWLESLSEPEIGSVADLPPVPEVGPRLDEAELARQLFVEGLASDYVDRLMSRFAALKRIASWYASEEKRPVGRPSEHETVAYLVLPLLHSLGWSEQTAAVEWNRVDVALFNSMPSSDASLACIVEAKLLGRSVFSPVDQAANYAQRPGRDHCDRLVVTDGIRYTVHRQKSGKFQLEAYLNLLNLRGSYPVYGAGCGGAVQAILGMAR